MEDNKCLYIKIKYFSKKDQTEGLFDYGYKYPYELEYQVKNDCFFFLNFFNENANKIEKKESQFEYNSNINDILFHVRKSFKNNNYEIINPLNNNMKKNEKNIKYLNNNAWYVIKSNPEYLFDNYDNYNEDYILNENDIIKFGVKKYEIIKKYIKNKSINDQNYYNISDMNEKSGLVFNIDLKSTQYIISMNDEEEDLFPNSRIEEEKEEKKKKCRKCEKYDVSEENPLLCICKCKDYIHYECLKEILNESNNIEISKNQNVKIYKYRKFICNKCSFLYPIKFKIKNDNKNEEKIFSLLKFNTESDYIILESLDDIKDKKHKKNNDKTIYIIEFNNSKEVNIGRDTSKNQFIIEDVSVSREHALIKYNKEDGKLILENKSKKYGTSVLIKGNIKMKEKEINFQVGNSYIMAKIINQNNNKINKGIKEE